MKSIRLFIILIIIFLHGMIYAQYGYFPPASSINYQPDTLTIYPPDSLPGEPVVLLGYNIYVDEDFYGNVMVSDPLEVVEYYLDDESLVPGTRVFCANAVYNDWISESACDTAAIAYGYELPVYEDWSSGSFETLQWTTNSDHWVVATGEGNPAPSAIFHGEPGLTNYEASLESFPMTAIGMTIGIVWLDFEIKLEATQATGDEKLTIQVWNSISQVWTTVAEYDNEEGNLSWEWEHLNIKNQAQNKVFKFRFLAKGVNSADISSWQIDNIKIYRKCEGPSDLDLTEFEGYNLLEWILPDGCGMDEWIHWDDGMNAGNAIGTNTAVEFDVAARWTHQQIANYEGTEIDQVRFFPAEWQALYNVRIWSGEGPDTLILDQFVPSPLIGQWNTITLNPTVILDISKDVWVGYHINTETGYPAGVDEGPAINGYGNMIYFDSTWQTLLEINPELDFNWNIACHVRSYGNHSEWDYNIYRKENAEDYLFLDTVIEAGIYRDSNLLITDHYCYKVTAVWMKNGDTCESNYSNEICEELWYGTILPDFNSVLRIFPNPASSYLNIKSPEKISEVRVYNLLGECELKMEIGNWETRVDVSGLETGVYFVEVVTGKMNYKDKILIFK